MLPGTEPFIRGLLKGAKGDGEEHPITGAYARAVTSPLTAGAMGAALGGTSTYHLTKRPGLAAAYGAVTGGASALGAVYKRWLHARALQSRLELGEGLQASEQELARAL